MPSSKNEGIHFFEFSSIITPQNTILTFDIHGVLFLNQIEKKMHSLHGATR